MKRLALHQMTIAAPKVTQNPMKMKSLTLIALKQTCRKRQKSIRSIETRQCKCGEDEQACNWGITISDVLKKLNCLELSSTELAFVTLGAIQRSVNCSDVSASGRTEKNCKLLRMSFFFHGKKICRKTFLFLHFIRKSEFCSLVKHYWDDGVSLRIHDNNEGCRSDKGLQLFFQKLLKKFGNM